MPPIFLSTRSFSLSSFEENGIIFHIIICFVVWNNWNNYFFGYLMIAPLIPIGDTGKVFSLLNIPWVIQVMASIIAIAMVTIILMKSAKQFERYAIEDFGSVEVNRKNGQFH